MYSKSYPHLRDTYANFPNFEELARTLDQFYPELINLNVLEHEAKHNRVTGSYFVFFDTLMQKLKGLYTAEEICRYVNTQLQNNNELRQCFHESLIFVPPVDGIESKQIGFHEKTATGTLKIGEPLTHLDMLRSTFFLQQYFQKVNYSQSDWRNNTKNEVAVISISTTSISESERLKNQNKALLVNFNLDPQGIAKWGVIDLRKKDAPTVYCETPLLDSEIAALEQKLRFVCPEVMGKKANNLVSTGYTALAWLDQNITHAWNFDENADFNILLADYILTAFVSDVNGVQFTCKNNEYDRFFTPALKYIINQQYGGINSGRESESGSKKWTNYSLFRMAAMTMLGQIEGEAIAMNDLAKAIEIIGTKQLSLTQFNEHYSNLAYRSKIPRLAHTLSRFGTPPILQEKENLTHLEVPENINFKSLQLHHRDECQATDTSSSLFDFIRRPKQQQTTPEEEAATAMVLTTFRARAKKPMLSISLPKQFQLNEDEQTFLCNLMQDNAHITKLMVNDNQSLLTLKKNLLPVIARNRWLAANDYLPPMVDNFWQRAVNYWFTYLNECQDLNSEQSDCQLFKNCVHEMGLTGLQKVLASLRNEHQRQLLEKQLGKNQPPFYLSCQPKETKEYYQTLIRHFEKKDYFPFSELHLGYQAESDSEFITLLASLKTQPQIEKIAFTNCLCNQDDFAKFLQLLLQKALENKWTTLILIPELEQAQNHSSEYHQLHLLYSNLNNLITHNRHEILSEKLVLEIENVDRLNKDEIHEQKIERLEQTSLEKITRESLGKVLGELDHLKEASWPIHRGGSVQLQLQQQQEVQQSRQIEVEQHKVRMNQPEEILIGEQVTYENIDRLLGDYYQQFKTEHVIDSKSAPLKTDNESELQGLFHTWIGANPDNEAANIVHSMTIQAAKMQLRNHKQMVSSLSEGNLPDGFYPQRDKEQRLVRCYNPELGAVNASNPLTIQLNQPQQPATAWTGDFRILDFKRYLTANGALTKADFQLMAVFAKLQPLQNYDDEYAVFCEQNPQIQSYFAKNKALFLQHWPLIMQAWHYQGKQAIEKLVSIGIKQLYPDCATILEFLLHNQDAAVISFAKRMITNDKTLRAFGQIINHHGEKSAALFLNKLQQMEATLGKKFFSQFFNNVIAATDNFAVYISPEFFISINEMISTFSSQSNTQQAWLTFATKHKEAIPQENIETLWLAFKYITSELQKLGLELEGDEFGCLKPGNMLVVYYNILQTLRHLPDMEKRLNFLHNLHQFKLNIGDVHYAVQNENFRYLDKELQLHDFSHGSPTYAANLKDIYQWPNELCALYIKRTLATRSQFNQAEYDYLCKQLLAKNSEADRNILVIFLFVKFSNVQIKEALGIICKLNRHFVDHVAKNIHQAVFTHDLAHPNITLESLIQLEKDFLNSNKFAEKTHALLQKFPQGNLLESLTILEQRGVWAQQDKILSLFEENYDLSENYPNSLRYESYKLAALLNIHQSDLLREFYSVTANLSPIVLIELNVLIRQLLSIDYKNSVMSGLYHPDNFPKLIECIQTMQNHPDLAVNSRTVYMNHLYQQGLRFHFSKSGEYRALRDEEYPMAIDFFTDHKERLWRFLKGHTFVSTLNDTNESVQPLLNFFKRLQMNNTYLNEVEPLLATLEKTQSTMGWPIEFLNTLLHTLQPENTQESYPLEILHLLINHPTFSAKAIDHIDSEFPSQFINPIKGILKNTTFNRQQQLLLCDIALKEQAWQKNNQLLAKIVALLSLQTRQESRDAVLALLANNNDFATMSEQFTTCQFLLEYPYAEESVSHNWAKSSAIWLNYLAKTGDRALFEQLQEVNVQCELILYILAFSALEKGLLDEVTYQHHLKKKSSKLIRQLANLSLGDLRLLAKQYPAQPCPKTDDLLQIIKKHHQPLTQSLSEFATNPHPKIRPDHQQLSAMRHADFERMLTNSQVTRDGQRFNLNAPQMVTIGLIFSEIKKLEQGTSLVLHANKPINQLSQNELAQAFQAIGQKLQQHGDDPVLLAQLWAVLFEAMGRTTNKYPHMAQQFALIANDIAISSTTQVLQLATGEGKSHFVAMRAAKHAVLGKTVDVCTAKRSLAKRDQKDYEPFFNYLGLSSAYIHPQSTHESYTQKPIHYSILGDLSLFMDEQKFKRNPIRIPKEKRVGLFDEFDFIRFEEGPGTLYNHARSTGRTPKQMQWFYDTLNRYYAENLANKLLITKDDISNVVKTLLAAAGSDSDRLRLTSQLLKDPLQLVRWLQSAQEAFTSQKGVKFTVLEQAIQVGQTSYLMQEIVPLSADNQPMIGSTFSAGVQQLLATRLNNEAKQADQPMTFHVHPESNILSSQFASELMRTLWGSWEGFSGTISAAQAKTLHQLHQTQVLHVQTNEVSLRHWHAPSFYDTETALFSATVQQARQCLAANKSILFCCANDKQVLALKSQLSTVLSKAELAQFIFYTNEDKLTSEEVLANKKTQEQWKDGKKQKAAALLASGFGRGDNVDVEVVFVCNANDFNDLQQKGGRTARNGEPGEVFQFYNINELRKEEQALLTAIKQQTEFNEQALQHVKGNNEQEKCLQRVLLLREYQFSLQNTANEGFHAALAQFSSWSMDLLAKIENELHSAEFASQISFRIKSLEKSWMEISNNNKLAAQNKIAAVEAHITTLAQEMLTANLHLQPLTTPFTIHPYSTFMPNLIAETPLVTEKSQKDKVFLTCRILALNSQNIPCTRQASLSSLIAKLSNSPEDLHQFALDSEHYRSLEELINQLEIRIQQLSSTATQTAILLKAAQKPLTGRHLLKGVNEVTKERFITALRTLHSDVAEQLILELQRPQNASAEQRLIKALPLMQYLGQFTLAQQQQWAFAYIDHYSEMCENATLAELELRFASTTIMSQPTNQHLWQLCKTNAPNNNHALWQTIQEIYNNRGAACNKLFLQWERMSFHLSEPERTTFFESFIHVMQHCHQQNDWETFTKLVNRTEQWWLKRDKPHRLQLVALWQTLDNNQGEIKTLLANALKQEGKNWFKQLMQQLPLLTRLSKIHHPLLRALWLQKEDPSIINTVSIALETCQKPISIHEVNTLLALNQDTERLSQNIHFLNRDLPVSQGLKLEMVSLLDELHDDLPIAEQQQIRDAFISAINHLSTSHTQLEIMNLIEGLLPHYKNLVLKEQAVEGKMSLTEKCTWFIDFCVKNPAAYPQMVDYINSNSVVTVERIITEFKQADFSDNHYTNALKMVNDRTLSDFSFSDVCQMMSTYLKILNDQQQFGDTWRQDQQQQFASLSPKKQLHFLHSISENSTKISANPYAINPLLIIMRLDAPATVCNQLATVLWANVDKKAMSNQQLGELTSRLTRFIRASDPTQVDLLAHKMQQDVTTAQRYWSDNTISYLANQVKPEQRMEVQRSIDFFYQQKEKTHANPALMFDLTSNSTLQEMFNFVQPKPVMREQRIVWMHALNHQAFVQNTADEHTLHWSQEKNDQLLESGFAQYTAHAEHILASSSEQLTSHQQQQLLTLSHELSIIGRPQLEQVNESKEQINSLRDHLSQAISQYQATRFKSNRRGIQINQLQTRIDLLMRTEPSVNRYQQILSAISIIRQHALANDEGKNATRWLKQNRSGSSRFLNTLNTIQEMVVKHWAHDPKAMQAFHQYKTVAKQEFFAISTSFHTALTNHINRQYCQDNKAGLRGFMYRMFDSSEASLRQLAAKFDEADQNSEQIKNVCELLRDQFEKLPGHLQTLAKEVLMRDEAMTGLLGKEASEPAEVILNSNF